MQEEPTPSEYGEGPLATGVNVISVFVHDLEEALHFYRNVLGMQDAGEMPPGRCLTLGDVTFYLEGGRSGPREPDLSGPAVCPCLAASSVGRAHKVLLETGATVIGEYTEFSSEFALFRFADPSGNVFEVAGRP